ncbi:MAG TPA: branched-chain amino acid ABC transporter substrate-binding protein [Symbiobacteriaceae bacterium]|jgi:branched-chain amino acid transport system substrate-binding protein
MKRIAALLIAGILLITGCTSATKTDPGAAKGPIKLTIASMSPLSGSQAAQGESIRYGAELAVKDRQEDLKKAGYEIAFLPLDDQAKPEQGTQLAEQILTKKEVIALVGTLNSSVVIPVSEKLKDDNLVIVSPANTNINVTDRKLANVNRIVARDDAQGPAGADFIAKNLKATSVYIIHDKTTYGQGLAEQVKKQAEKIGLKVDGFEGVNPGDKDYSAVLTKVKGGGSPVIFFGGMTPEAAQIAKGIKDKGMQVKLVGADGIDSADLVNLGGDAVNGVYFTSVAKDVSKTAEGQAFVKKYTEFSKKPMDNFGAYGYDSATIVINALLDYAKANPGKTPTRKELMELVRKTKGFKGVAGTATFDAKGDNTEAQVFIYQIQNGKYPGVLVQ